MADETMSFWDPEVATRAAGSAATARSDDAIAPGTCLGRYTVRAQLGGGGMGEVYAAHDPELDRLVALKVLLPELAGRSPEARARFQREAQALARLNHPNVVAVYDVGLVGDRVFVAMELIEGRTLASWLAEAPRSWREVVDVFLPAGRGLAAAHAAGLVHRDVKPSNVMVGERVCVVDFGLARPANAIDEPASMTATPMLEGTITRTGQALGTPAYMAPEQRAGLPATAASDQYSFAVALHEALLGMRPGLPEPAGPPRVVPAHLRALLDRALQPAAPARYPSMQALLADLARDPAQARRRWALGAAGVATLGAAIAITRTTAEPTACADAGARMAGIWDPARKASLGATFAASGRPYADNVWSEVSGRLDGYARGWVDMHGEACRATRIEGRQSERLMDLRMACLDRRRSVLGALVDVWSRGLDASTLDAAHDAVAGLAPLDECADARLLTERAPLPADPVQVARIAAARARLDQVRALTLVAHLPDARAAAATARAEADAIGWPQVRAEATFAEADVLGALGDPAAEARFLEAARLAGAAHDDRLHAEALVELVDHIAHDQQSGPRALLAADIASGAIARAGDDERLRVRLLRYRGDALVTAGKHDDARAAFTAAREQATARFGPSDNETLAALTKLASLAEISGDNATSRKISEANLAATAALLGEQHPRVAAILNSLGNTSQNVGDFDAAAGYYRRALAIIEATAGRESASAAMIMNNLGAIDIGRDEPVEAEALLSRALATREHLLGPEHPHVAMTLGNLALLRRKQLRNDEALAMLERALAIKLKAYGPVHRSVAISLEGIADTQRMMGRIAQAIETHRRTLEMRRQALGKDHPLTHHSEVQLAEVLARNGRCREARPLLAAWADNIDRPSAAGALATLAHCDLVDGRPAQAVERLGPALATMDRNKGFAIERGSMRWLLSRALRALGRRAEAIAAAERAEPDLAVEPGGAEELAELRRWLRTARR